MDPEFKWNTRTQKLLVVEYWWIEQKGLCWHCKESMEPYHRNGTGNPEAATVEHLIPKRENGPDTLGNVRLAHARCNHALGALWSYNQQRLRIGLDPIPDKVAIHNSRAKAKARAERDRIRQSASDLSKEFGIPLVADKRRKGEVRHSLAFKGIPPPRGATLPDYVPPADPLPRPFVPKVRRPICAICGSIEVERDATIRWAIDRYEIAQQRDGWECRACDDECTVRWDYITGTAATPNS